MKRTFLTGLAVLVALGVAGPAAADKSTKADRTAAVSACTALRTAVGAQTFAQTYGVTSARAALARCAAKMVREAHQARHAAATSCATKAKGKGKGKGVAKAKARCAAAAAKAELKQEIDATKNAAFACKAERQSMGAEAFAGRYGTNTNKRNAFGKCVSQKAKENAGKDGEDSQTGARLTATLAGTAGSGTFALTVVGAQRICYTLTATGLVDITAAHIHVKPVAPGNIVVPLEAPTDGSSSGCVKVAKSLLQQILAAPSNYYVNVHTAAAPAGAIQGDLAKA